MASSNQNRPPSAELEPSAAAEASARAIDHSGVDARTVPRPGGRALVVDDEPAIRRFARLLLDEAGFEVELAADGDAGLAIVRESGAPDLVLLDLTMPGMGGLEVLTELRRHHPDVPVVLMSGYTEDEIASALASDPFAYFLQKPFTGESLEDVLRGTGAAASQPGD